MGTLPIFFKCFSRNSTVDSVGLDEDVAEDEKDLWKADEGDKEDIHGDEMSDIDKRETEREEESADDDAARESHRGASFIIDVKTLVVFLPVGEEKEDKKRNPNASQELGKRSQRWRLQKETWYK